jgi:hypothetical protein
MARFTAQKVSRVLCQPAFGEFGEILVLASPLITVLVVEAQTKLLVLLHVDGRGQTDGQWRVQLLDGLALVV